MGGWVGKENEGYRRKTMKTASVLSLWDEVVGNEGVGSGGEHTTGVVPHERVSLDMQITEHFVQAPPADEADDIRVNLGQEKGGHTSSAETSCREFGRKEAEVRA
jgi:hypothetical protein